ncbi:MAG TPA: GNAT family N-acetyltransferase, partial [Chitinophagaceae bacterium]|nr:GNAT family N-acetyltransferase [Chitinophagaceae bacterium]
LKEFPGYDALELERIYLITSATGKSYGTKAIRFSETYARKQNKEILWLKMMDSTTNHVFYGKMGFEPCGTRKLSFDRMKPELRGMTVMMKWL